MEMIHQPLESVAFVYAERCELQELRLGTESLQDPVKRRFHLQLHRYQPLRLTHKHTLMEGKTFCCPQPVGGLDDVHLVSDGWAQDEGIGVGSGNDMPVAERDNIGLERLRKLDNFLQNAFWEQEVAEDCVVFTVDDFTTIIADKETAELMET